MWRRFFLQLSFIALALSFSACGGLLQNKNGTISFHYSLWKLDPNGVFADIGCIDAGINSIRIDLLFQGVSVGSAESLCDAFGNRDGLSVTEELGEFLADHESVTFDQLCISAIGPDNTLVPIGMRLNSGDVDAQMQQETNFVEPVTIFEGQQLIVSFPGLTSSQINEEVQLIIP